MPFWAVAAPIIASLAKGAYDANKARKARIAQEQQNELYATETIQKRVADAKAAGLHPLYALGAQPYTPAALPVGGSDFGGGADWGQIGSQIDEYLAKSKEPGGEVYPNQKVMMPVPHVLDQGPGADDRYAPGNVLMVPPREALEYYQADAVRQGIEESKARTEEMQLRANKERAAMLGGPPELVEMKPDQVIHGNPNSPWRTAGKHSGWTTFQFGPDFPIDLPSGGSASESLESISESTAILAAVIEWNRAQYGPQWEAAARRAFPSIFGRAGATMAAPSDVPTF